MLKSPETGDYYNCANKTWTKVKDRILLNTNGWDCLDSNDGEMKIGLVNDAYFVCDGNEWRDATADEETRCRTNAECQGEKRCKEERKGMFDERDGVKFVCDGSYDWVYHENEGTSYREFVGTWRKANCAEIATERLCTDALQDSIVWECEDLGNFKIDYVCISNYWRAVSGAEDYTPTQWEIKRDAYNAAAMLAKANSDSMITDMRDGNTYRTVVMNGYRVFAEDLRYADTLGNVNLKGNVSWSPDHVRPVYTWTAAMNLDSKWKRMLAGTLITGQHQGICPDGWHVPDTTEWHSVLSVFKTGAFYNFAALQMKGFSAKLYSDWSKATDASGFSAIPYGAEIREYWSATEVDETAAMLWMYTNGFSKDGSSGTYPVRCIQDYPIEP
jgi:uncharacterized protein (TIGR02145 family)